MVDKTTIYESVATLLEGLDDGGVWDFIEYMGKTAPLELSEIMESVGANWKDYSDFISQQAEDLELFRDSEHEPMEDESRV